jgi:hypothetical protein
MFDLAQERQAPLLVRARENRSLEEDEANRLWPKVEKQPIQGELNVHITGNQKRQERQATVSIRFCTVKLRPPRRFGQKKMSTVTIQAILVREEHPPENLAELVHLGINSG